MNLELLYAVEKLGARPTGVVCKEYLDSGLKPHSISYKWILNGERENLHSMYRFSLKEPGNGLIEYKNFENEVKKTNDGMLIFDVKFWKPFNP